MLLTWLGLFLVIAIARDSCCTENPPKPPAQAAAPPRTENVARSEFSPTWEYRTFGIQDGLVTLLGSSIALTSTWLGPPANARWRGGILFDDAVRSALRADSRAGRDRALVVGDTFYIGGALAPTLIDGLVVTLGVRAAPDVAKQMLLINLEAYAIAGALLIGAENVFARERPSVAPCAENAEYEAHCGGRDKKASFISGHTGVVATSAGLICAHHQYLHLYGNTWADTAACGLGIGAAVTTGVARLISDRHYASDTLAAFAVGAAAGYAWPLVRFYAGSGGQRTTERDWVLLPTLDATSTGLWLLMSI